MPIKFTHYGVDSLYQTLRHPFEDDLKKQGIKYIELPLLKEKVLKYTYEGKTRYAYIVFPNVPLDEGYVEEVYITERIPDDMSWKNLAKDLELQKDRNKEMILPTKARILWDEAESIISKSRNAESNNLQEWIIPVTKKEMNNVLISLGSSLEKLKESEYHDVPEIDELED